MNNKHRFLFLDALRGFDMLLISGAGSFLVLLHGKTNIAWIDAVANQFKHPAWNGFTFYDFIFPLFLFLAGVSLSISVDRAIKKSVPNSKIINKALRRACILILIGIAYKNAPIPFNEPSQIRFGSVLGRIGIATFFATVLFLNFDVRKRILWIAGILLSYYAALFLIPVPGYGAGDLSFEGNLVGWIDRTFMPGRLLQGTYDELAILTQLPSLCLTLFGVIAGELMMRSDLSPSKKTLRSLGIGASLIVSALIWNIHFPINKHLWTSSFILLTAGMAYIFLAAFYWIIEIRKIRRWAFFFQVIGVNSLLIYLVYRFVNFGQIAQLIFGGIFEFFPEPWHEVLRSLTAMILVWLFLYFCYRKKLFLKV